MDIPRPKPAAHGLSFLLGNTTAQTDAPGARLVELPLDDVVRNESQPRTWFDPDAIAALAESIAVSGVIQPIAVRPATDGRYEIIAGERRWLASRRAGRRTVPAVIHEVGERESLVLALAENLVRENLNPLETARAYAALLDEFSMSVSDLARAVGKSRPAVANTLRLLELPDDVLAVVEDGRLSEGHGRALLQLHDRPAQRRFARLAIDRAWSVRALEQAVRDELSTVGKTPLSSRKAWNRNPSPELEEAVARLATVLSGTTARVKVGDKGGKLELICSDPAALESVVARLTHALAAPLS